MSKRAERRLKWTVGMIFVVLLLVLVVLYLAPAFRLRLAQQFGLVPGADATQVAGPGEARLIVISYPEQVQLSGPIYRQVARFILRGNQLTDLANGQRIALPSADISSIQVSDDRGTLYLVGAGRTTTVDLGTDQIGTRDGGAPSDAPKAFIRPELCSGVSPGDRYTLCLRVGGEHNTRYLWGNWEVLVRPYGQSVPWQRVYRGRGAVPIVGFAPDGRSVYMYNELGIWQAPIH